MNNILSLPPRSTIRNAIGPCVASWARTHGHAPHAVHNTISRCAGRVVDLDRMWGRQTHAILLSLAAALDRDAA